MKLLSFFKETRNSNQHKRFWLVAISGFIFILVVIGVQILKVKELSLLKKQFFSFDGQAKDQKKILQERESLSTVQMKLQEKFNCFSNTKNNLFFVLKSISEIIPYGCHLEQIQYEKNEKIIFTGYARNWKSMNRFVRLLTNKLKSKTTYFNTKKNEDHTLSFELHINV